MAPKREMQRSQLRPQELALIDKIVGAQKETPTQAWKTVCVNRAKEGKFLPPDPATVHRYVKGETHKRDASENRGAKRMLTRMDVLRLNQARRRLVKRYDGEYRVTHQMVLDEAWHSLSCDPCLRVVKDAFHENNIYYRKPREKICITSDDAKKRNTVCTEWLKKRASFWTDKVDAYRDEKSFPLPLTPAQRKRFRQTRVTGHLRLPSEGTERGFTKPKDKHSWTGVPSATISAAMKANRILMWHVHTKNWGGKTAAELYKGPLATALHRASGLKRKYIVVEDGDRKGNASNLGKMAKKEVGIEAMTLPPRTPSLMPFDYAVWKKIVDEVIDGAPEGRETKEQYLARLEAAARSLPRSYCRKIVGRMRENVQAIVNARGGIPKND